MSSAALDINRDLTEALDAICQKYLRSNDCGSYIMPESTPGISILASFDGKIVANFCRGYALRYVARDGQELPKAQWVEIDDNSIFDCR